MCKKLLLLLLLLPFQLLSAQTKLLTDFPEGYTPEEVGKRLAYRFVGEKHALHAGKWIGYPETFYWNGALKYAAVTKDKELIKLLEDKFAPLFTSEKALQPIMNHVDLNMFGSLPLDMYRVTKDKKYLYLGLPYADSQWEVPANAKPKEKEWAEKGYSWQTRLWIDDMYMITIVQTHAYKVTKDRKYIDRAAKEMVMYLDELQRPNGLFYHAPDVPFYWGRLPESCLGSVIQQSSANANARAQAIQHAACVALMKLVETDCSTVCRMPAGRCGRIDFAAITESSAAFAMEDGICSLDNESESSSG